MDGGGESWDVVYDEWCRGEDNKKWENKRAGWVFICVLSVPRTFKLQERCTVTCDEIQPSRSGLSILSPKQQQTHPLIVHVDPGNRESASKCLRRERLGRPLLSSSAPHPPLRLLPPPSAPSTLAASISVLPLVLPSSTLHNIFIDPSTSRVRVRLLHTQHYRK